MNINWLANEARQIHDLFSSMFYSIILLTISLGVVLSYFKMPMGQVPEFLNLVGRAILAAFLLAAFPDIMNELANITDDLANQVGQLNNLKLVVARAGEKIGNLTWSWVSVKDSIILIISYVTYFLLYASVYVADSMYLLTWTLLYIFSPLLIAAFTMPKTATATIGLFQALIEVCLWKLSWSVLAALLWSFALSTINDPEYDVDFITAILLNIMLAFSVLLTPLIVRSLLKGGLQNVSSTMGATLLAVTALTPTELLNNAKRGVKHAASSVTGNSKSDENWEYHNKNDSRRK